MNSSNASSVAERAERQPSSCCIAYVRNLLERVRTRHRQDGQDPRPGGGSDNAESDLPRPSLHDILAGELEASLMADGGPALTCPGLEIRHDDPAELARARVVFALTLLVPLLLVSASMVLLDGALGHALHALLRFSMFALAVPLAVSLTMLAVRTFQRKRNRHAPVGSLITSRLEQT